MVAQERGVSRFSGLWQATAMTAARPSPVQFLTDVLNAVHEVTGRRPPPTWTHVDKVQHKLGTDNIDPRRYLDRLEWWEKRTRTAGASDWRVVNDMEHLDRIFKKKSS